MGITVALDEEVNIRMDPHDKQELERTFEVAEVVGNLSQHKERAPLPYKVQVGQSLSKNSKVVMHHDFSPIEEEGSPGNSSRGNSPASSPKSNSRSPKAVRSPKDSPKALGSPGSSPRRSDSPPGNDDFINTRAGGFFMDDAPPITVHHPPPSQQMRPAPPRPSALRHDDDFINTSAFPTIPEDGDDDQPKLTSQPRPSQKPPTRTVQFHTEEDDFTLTRFGSITNTSHATNPNKRPPAKAPLYDDHSGPSSVYDDILAAPLSPVVSPMKNAHMANSMAGSMRMTFNQSVAFRQSAAMGHTNAFSFTSTNMNATGMLPFDTMRHCAFSDGDGEKKSYKFGFETARVLVQNANPVEVALGRTTSDDLVRDFKEFDK